MERLKKSIMDIDPKSMAEIMNFNEPPRPVHDIMSGVLLLLRQNEETTKVNINQACVLILKDIEVCKIFCMQ